MTAIVADRLVAGYDDVPVLRDVSLRVEPGEVVVLLGANGAGKTTTLLALAGELPLTSGAVHLHGAPAVGRLQHRARAGLAYLPEGRGVLRTLTVRENLRLGRGSVDAALAAAPELERLLSRRAGVLSGGEQQILSLARALAASPKVLLADEVSLGLAPVVVQRMLDAMRAAADDGAAVLLVEQHAALALAVADRAYVLQRGQVVLHGTAGELRDRIDDLGSAYLTAKDPQ